MNEELKEKLRGLSPEQLKALVTKMGKGRKELPKMPINPNNAYPLSASQKRIWFLSAIDPDSYLYTNPIAIQVSSPQVMNIDRWEKSFKMVAGRNDIMRTSFSEVDGELRQIIHDDLDFEFNVIDFTHLSSDDQRKELDCFLRKDGQETIRIDEYPLFRHTYIKLEKTKFVLVYTSHHIISDAWSSSILFTEVIAAYDSLTSQEEDTSSASNYQFVDHVHWENDWEKSPAFDKSLEAWKGMIPDTLEPINLPYDFQRPQLLENVGGLITERVNVELTEKLAAFSKANNANMFHTLLAGFNVLLNNYSHQEDIAVGIPLANREVKEFQTMIGMFLNTLPFVSKVNRDGTILDYIKEIKGISEKIQVNQQFPFQRLVDEVQPVRDLSVSAIFQILFVYQNIPSLYEVNGTVLEPIRTDFGVSKYELNLWVEEVNGELYLSLTYQTSLFKRESVELLLERYLYLLNEILSNGTTPIRALQIEESNESVAPIISPSSGSYLDEFRKTSLANPDVLAVNDGENQLSFSELDLLSSRLAVVIAEKTQANLVGLLVDRSYWQIVCILAIHKAGKAYVPLNEEWSIAHRDEVISDSKIGLTITETSTENLPSETLTLDQLKQELENSNLEGIDLAPKAEDLAYIIYTSGSTGKPKGVQVEHGQIQNYSNAIWKRLKLNVGDRCALVSSMSVDLGYTQVYPAISFGACIDILPKSHITDPILLEKYFETHPHDSLKIVPSHLASLLSAENGVKLLPKKVLVLGGEKIPTHLIQTIRELAPNLRIINHYGPTETTIGVITNELGNINSNDLIPIGAALDGNFVRIEDEEGNQVPKGIIGEIVIYGNNVTRGYLNDADDVKKRFVTRDRIRSYRTGDLGKLNLEDNIEFIGRSDRQVKLKGHRIELSALEFLATGLSSNKDLAVNVKNDSLRFFIGGEEEESLEASLTAQLPSYLVPFEIVYLKEIPRLGNGKVDYTSLSLLESSKSKNASTSFRPPKDELELKLLGIWKKVLQLDTLSLEDNFFEAGGNSLVAIKLISEVNRGFNVQLNVGEIFESNSVEAMASKLRKGDQGGSESNALVLLRKGTGNTNLFLVHPAGGDVLVYYSLASQLDPALNVYGLQNGVMDTDHASIPEMATDFLAQIGTLSESAIFAGWSMGALVAYEMALQLDRSSGTLAEVILLDQIAPGTAAGANLSEGEKILLFAQKVGELVGGKLDINRDEILEGSALERSTLFLREFKKFKLVPPELKEEEFHGYLQKMIHHNKITAEYTGASYNGKVNLMRADDSSFVPNEFNDLEGYGWENYATDLAINPVIGNHITMMRP
ncbi:MAG: amino acid adenylation domain-containing protein, partial [Crocinitomicaceae bacterium]